MSRVLFIVGGLTLIAGVGMIGFGIPINEFSFGNTLILAGTTAAVGGLIILGLGAVVAQLRQLAEGLNIQAPTKPSPALFEAPPISQSLPEAGTPFAEKTTAAPAAIEPSLPAPIAASGLASELSMPAPALRNPEIADEQTPPKPRPFVPPPVSEERRPWRLTATAEALPERGRAFEVAWPAAEAKAAKPLIAEEAKPEPKLERPREEPPVRKPDVMPPPRPSEPRAAAILKSGIVDGMGYTLYVDGSIEAELPQGTLRFASINELRAYLEKNH